MVGILAIVGLARLGQLLTIVSSGALKTRAQLRRETRRAALGSTPGADLGKPSFLTAQGTSQQITTNESGEASEDSSSAAQTSWQSQRAPDSSGSSTVGIKDKRPIQGQEGAASRRDSATSPELDKRLASNLAASTSGSDLYPLPAYLQGKSQIHHHHCFTMSF